MAATTEQQIEALSRARNGQSWANYAAIIEGFTSRGIPEEDILPRVNVFTYNAWRALGRQVRRGEKGVCGVTYVPMTKKNAETGEHESIGARPKNVWFFHLSQTDEIKS